MTVLSGLPSQLEAPVIVLQHLDPARTSQLPRILGRHSTLTPEPATDGAVLRPATLVVVPSGYHLLVTAARTVALIRSGSYPPSRPSADLLLTSLGLAVGPAAIAVVLSGYGTDGATGAGVVHHFGGLVIASDQARSAHFAMPSAAIDRQRAAVQALPVHEIAARLVELVGVPGSGAVE